MNNWATVLSTLAVMVLLPASGRCLETQQKILYVSPRGSDANPGTEAKPFLTLERAREEIRAVKKGSSLPPGGVRVLLRGGRHQREDVFRLGPEDSGEQGAPVVYSAYPGEKPVVTGGRRIGGWKPLAGPVKGMRPGMAGKIYAAPIEKGWKFHFLYVNGEQQTLSRSQNSAAWHTWPRPEAVGPVGPEGQKLTFKPGELDELDGLDGIIEINLLPVNFWNTISVLRGIDPRARTAFRHSKNPTTFWTDSFQEGNYNLLNALRFIDEPGEWAVDRNEGNVYLYPPGGALRPDDEVIAPRLYRLIHVHGDMERDAPVRHIRFEGIEFHHTDRMPEDAWPEEWIKRQAELPDGMIYVEDAEDLLVRDCAFLWSGSYGVDLEKHAQRITIAGNEMGFTGCGGVLLQGYGPGLKDVNRNNVITRNHIHNTGTGGFLHSAAITLYQSGSNEISFNIIHQVPYVGVQICGANWDAYGPERVSGNPDPDEPGGVDTYGKAHAQYRTRWEDLPLGRNSGFTRESFKPYLHTANNRVHHNVILEYLQVLSDGAPLYAWSTGMGNLFYRNVAKRAGTSIEGQKWVFAMYMDDYVDGAVLSDNIIWAQADSGREFFNKGQNMWSGNVHGFPGKPAEFDRLLEAIVREGSRRGGWPGKMPPEIIRFTTTNEKR